MTTTREERDLITLEQGQYWRALEAIPEQHIEEGDVLLLESIRDVDNQAHTIILRTHPNWYGKSVTTKVTDENGEPREYRDYNLKEHRFLVAEFLRKFVLEPDYVRIRQDEVAAIQARIVELQDTLKLANTSTPGDLKEYTEAGLKKWADKKQIPAEVREDIATSDSVQLVPLSTSLSAGQVFEMRFAAERQFEIATLKAAWIGERNVEIKEAVEAMLPFYQEQAAAALAQTEDVRRYVSRLQSGIESLDLYVGTNVEVLTIKKGESASPDEPLTIMQRKLFADEELSVFADVEETFDHSEIKTFFKVLGERPGLVAQIFPTPRCIVAYAATARERDYGDVFVNGYRNALNRRVGLLVRDGENLYAVSSPIDSHLTANNLFPSKREIDAIFQEDVGFWERREGTVGREITFNDVRYTDRLSKHERLSLHYKRFLILLAGLDHRENLFGTFYPGPKGMDFVSTGFQRQHMHFIHDAEGDHLLPEVKRLTFRQWAALKNAYLRSGSRVFATWANAMNSQSAPGAVTREDRYNHFKAKPIESTSMAIAYRQGDAICVSVPVKSNSWRSSRVFDARVDLGKASDGYAITYLVLDAVKPEELEAYIYDRTARKDHLDFIQFFKRAVKFLREEREQEAPARQALKDALAKAAALSVKVPEGPEVDALIDETVIAWRAANRGAQLPDTTKLSDAKVHDAWKSLLDYMWDRISSAKYVEAAEQWARNEDFKPLRLVLTGNDKFRLYTAPRPEEREDRVRPHVWVHAVDFTARKKGWVIKKTAQNWAELPQYAASETTLKEWDGAEDWAGLTDPLTLPEKRALFDVVANFDAQMLHFFNPANYWMIFEDWKRVRAEIRAGKYVRNPDLAIPFGVVYRDSKYYYLTLHNSFPENWMYAKAPTPEEQKEFHDTFIGQYANKRTNSEDLIEKAPKHPNNWGFYMVPVKQWKEPFLGPVDSTGTGVHASQLTKSLNHHLQKIRTEWAEKNNRTLALLCDDGYDFDGRLGIDARIKQIRVSRCWPSGSKEGAFPYEVVFMLMPIGADGHSSEEEAERKALPMKDGISWQEVDKFYDREEARRAIQDTYGAVQMTGEGFPTPVNPDVEYWFSLPEKTEEFDTPTE